MTNDQQIQDKRIQDKRIQDKRIQDKRIHPAYAEGFRCIGPSCEDTCCKGWTVPIDRATFERYQNLPAGPLRVLVNSSVARVPESGDASENAQAGGTETHARPFAAIRMNEANECPLLTDERLCRIQSELGADLLSYTCATYPRMVHSVSGVKETALAFSCPEAVRLVLLTPELPLREDGCRAGDGENADAEPDANLAPADLYPLWGSIRGVVLRLVRARSYPLWQRLFLMNLLCQRLDSIARGEDNSCEDKSGESKSGQTRRSVAAFLGGFEAAVGTGELRGTMEALPVNGAAQLDMVLRLSGLMLHKSIVTQRFVECVRAFTAGIGNGPGATLESLAAKYALAHDRYYSPFFERRPHILENILINTIFRCRFPFGKEGACAEPMGAGSRMSREFALLAVQFALIRGLLIGVAGHYGAAFSETHVVHTVQAASKHFEHHPEFLDMAHALLVESRMNGARGLAILLRNAEAEREAGQSIPASIGPVSVGGVTADTASIPPGQFAARAL